MKYWTRIFWLQTYPSLFLRIMCLPIESRHPALFVFISTALCVIFCNYLLPAFVQHDICQKKKKKKLVEVNHNLILQEQCISYKGDHKRPLRIEVSYKTEVDHLSAPGCGNCEAVVKMRKNMYRVPSMTQESSSEGTFGKSKVDQEKLQLWSSDLGLNLDLLLGLKVC